MSAPCEHFNLTMVGYDKTSDRPPRFIVHAKCTDCGAPVDILSSGPEEVLQAELDKAQS